MPQRAFVPLFFIALSLTRAHAADFHFYKDHCAAREYEPKDPHSGGTGGFLDSTAWAETGQCTRVPIAKLVTAARSLGVMTWEGITRIAGVEQLPPGRPGDLFRVKVMYEARHKQVWCQSAQWPLAWRAAEAGRGRVYITVERVPGGDSNGAYVKKTSAKIELLQASDTETSLHMRYEIQAPSQGPASALGAVVQYFDRLQKAAMGEELPGAVVDPECPY